MERPNRKKEDDNALVSINVPLKNAGGETRAMLIGVLSRRVSFILPIRTETGRSKTANASLGITRSPGDGPRKARSIRERREYEQAQTVVRG